VQVLHFRRNMSWISYMAFPETSDVSSIYLVGEARKYYVTLLYLLPILFFRLRPSRIANTVLMATTLPNCLNSVDDPYFKTKLCFLFMCFQIGTILLVGATDVSTRSSSMVPVANVSSAAFISKAEQHDTPCYSRFENFVAGARYL
jgi:hypothetical protein